MPLDPELVRATRDWLLRADEDLDMADAGLERRRSRWNSSAYHSQQAAEKALKAFLTWHSRAFPKTHAIEVVGEACCAIDSTLQAITVSAWPLTHYAWKARYPGDWTPPTEADAREAIRLAQAVYTAILERLPAEVRPY